MQKICRGRKDTKTEVFIKKNAASYAYKISHLFLYIGYKRISLRTFIIKKLGGKIVEKFRKWKRYGKSLRS